MARLPRIDVPDLPQHLIVRGNNRSDLFRDDSDRWLFMKFLGDALAVSGCDLHSYVLMSNHVHLLATGREHGALSNMMQSIGRRFSRFINKRHDRTGGLFEGRFKSSLIQSDRYLLTCMRYIELNPVRAGMVRLAGEFKWSSHCSNSSGQPSGLLTPHDVYLHLATTAVSRGRAYQALFSDELDQSELDAIRACLRRGRVLGEKAFQQRLAERLGRPVAIPPSGRPARGTG